MLTPALALSLLSATPLQLIDDWHELVELACLDCHSGERVESGVDLGAALDDPLTETELWTRAFDRVRAGEMPPEGGLDAEERAEWTAGLFDALDVDPTDPGRPTLRRLTRSQLRNVLRDLVAVDADVQRYLPRDASGYGFDTTGDTLFVSPLDFEQWYELVDEVVRQLLAREADRSDGLSGSANDRDAARAFIAEFVSRAFRRPATATEVDGRLALWDAALSDRAAPADALAEAVRATLLSPSFFYRVEQDRGDAEGPWPLDDHELAARLSFFLWGTLPDAALSARASAGALTKGGGFQAEVDRMLTDPRSKWLSTDFAAQWLGLVELRDVTPDVRRFREFNGGLRGDFLREGVHFFDDLVKSNRSVLEILDSDHAFVNARLAKHYGISGVEGNEIRRVPIEDRRRGGVLGMGGVLTVTSTPLRTSPVNRGQWVLERLLGRPAPPPPPNVGSLPEDDRQKDGLPLRVRLERHRRDPACASCHARMDPYGLALEPFDGIGRVRVGGGAEPAIDARVTLPTGQEVDGPAELKAALLANPEPFVQTLAEALFVYAVGRPAALADHPHLQAAVRAAAEDGYRVRTLIRGIVQAPAFTHRRLPRPR